MRIATAPPSGVKRIADAFADSGKRAAFMPYLMGGFPDLATSCGIGEVVFPVEETKKRVDAALYEAKNSGRGKWVVSERAAGSGQRAGDST